MGEIDLLLNKISEREEVHVDIAQEVLKLVKNIHSTYLGAESDLQKQYLLLFFKEILVSNGEIQHVEYAEFFKELLQLKAITYVKPSGLNEPSIINPLRGA